MVTNTLPERSGNREVVVWLYGPGRRGQVTWVQRSSMVGFNGIKLYDILYFTEPAVTPGSGTEYAKEMDEFSFLIAGSGQKPSPWILKSDLPFEQSTIDARVDIADTMIKNLNIICSLYDCLMTNHFLHVFLHQFRALRLLRFAFFTKSESVVLYVLPHVKKL